jgi:hypothetical protein
LELQAKADLTQDQPITLAGEAVVLGTGSAAFGKLAANSGVDIGDVDVTSLPIVAAQMATDTQDATGLTGSYATMIDISADGDTLTTIYEFNWVYTGDSEAVISFDGSTDHIILAPGSSGTRDFYAQGLSVAGDVSAKNNGTTPLVGDLVTSVVGV